MERRSTSGRVPAEGDLPPDGEEGDAEEDSTARVVRESTVGRIEGLE